MINPNLSIRIKMPAPIKVIEAIGDMFENRLTKAQVLKKCLSR